MNVLQSNMAVVVLLMAALSSIVAVFAAPYSTAASDINVFLDPRNAASNVNSTTQFLGGDVDISTDLTPRYTLFLYGDTLLGRWNIDDGSRICDTRFPFCFDVGTMPHSSFSIWDKSRREMQYFWNDGSTGVERSVLQPPWQSSSVVFWGTAMTPPQNDTLCIFGARVELRSSSANNIDPLSFVVNGTYVVCLDGVRARPTQPLSWTQRWAVVPGSGVSHGLTALARDVEWHSAVYAESSSPQASGGVYIFGEIYETNSTTDIVKANKTYAQVVAKISYAALFALDFSAFQVYSSPTKQWISVAQFLGPNIAQHRICDAAISEFTVQWSPMLQKYFIAFIECPTCARVCVKTSAALVGPWSADCEATAGLLGPPFNNASEVFCYALKVQSSLKYLLSDDSNGIGEERHVYSFVCNAWDALTLFRPGDGSVYIPNFRVLHLANASRTADDDGLGDVSDAMRTTIILFISLLLALALLVGLLVTRKEMRERLAEAQRDVEFSEEYQPTMMNGDGHIHAS